jgi:hypothetical protein
MLRAVRLSRRGEWLFSRVKSPAYGTAFFFSFFEVMGGIARPRNQGFAGAWSCTSATQRSKIERFPAWESGTCGGEETEWRR